MFIGSAGSPLRWLLVALTAMLVFSSASYLVPSGDSGSSVVDTVEAKKKGKKGKKKGKRNKAPTPTGCQFTKTATTWTLKANCTTRETIAVPSGVTLDGAGHTVTATGPIGNFDAAIVLARRNATATRVQNLTLIGSALSGPCVAPRELIGIRFAETSGAIDNVTISNLRLGDECGLGIIIDGNNAADVDVTNSRMSGMLGGIGYLEATGAIENNVLIDNGLGILASRAFSTVLVRSNQIQGEERGIEIFESPSATVSDNTVTGVGGVGILFWSSTATNAGIDNNTIATTGFGIVAVSSSSAAMTNNEITGPGANQSNGSGIVYQTASQGSVAGNTISGFACGINRDASAGTVTVGANILTGNTSATCGAGSG